MKARMNAGEREVARALEETKPTVPRDVYIPHVLPPGTGTSIALLSLPTRAKNLLKRAWWALTKNL